MSSEESHLRLLDSILRSAERSCEGELCSLENRRIVSALYLLYEIYHRADHRMNKYLKHLFVDRNTIASATLGKLALVIPRFRTDQFSRSFLPAANRLWNVLPSGVFSGDTLSSFKIAVNLCILRA